MTYEGHIENGAIVLNKAIPLQEGAKVHVEFVEERGTISSATPLRGTYYSYEAPFSPAVVPEDWNAVQ